MKRSFEEQKKFLEEQIKIAASTGVLSPLLKDLIKQYQDFIKTK